MKEKGGVISGQISSSEPFQGITGFNAGGKISKWCSIFKEMYFVKFIN